MGRIVAATEGLAVESKPDLGGQVAAKCVMAAGRWYCVSHDYSPANNFDKDTHAESESGDCVMAWVCYQHGVLEVP